MKALWFRRIAIALGALLLLLVAAAAALIATFDANRYKSLAVDWMKTERHRTLAIDGPIELSLFPRLAVRVSKVRLSESGRDDEFVALDEAALAVQVLPLLKKQLVIDRISARGVRATYLRNAQGVRNIDDLVSGGGGRDAEIGGGDSGPTLRFDVSTVQLDDLRLHVRDEKADVAGDVAVQSISSGRLAHRAASPVALRATALLTRPQAVKLALDGRMTVVLDLDKNAVAMTDLKLAVDGQSASVKGLSLTLDGALAWDGSAVRAGPLHMALKSATLGGNTLDPSTLDVQRALFSPSDERLELEALKVALAGRQGPHPFELALEWPQLAVAGQRLTGGPLSGHVKLAGPTALAGTFSSVAPSGTFEALRLPDVVVRLEGNVAERQIAGSVKADVVLHVARSAAAFERLEVRATLADPGLPPLQLTVGGDAGIDANAKSARWTLDGSLNANRFDSRGRASFAGAVPNMKADARFDSLDLDKLLPPDQPAAGAAARAPADTPVQLDTLEAVDGEFTLTADALAFRQYRVADAKVDATLSKGLLRINRLAGRAWSGQVQASGSADAKSHRVAVKLDASDVDIHALLKDVAGKDLLEGTGHVIAELASSGTTLGALRSHLAGSAALQLKNGAIKGINLARSLRQVRAALSLKQDAVSQANDTEKTDFTELSASARIADGVAQSDDLAMKSPFLRVGGAGRFDIGRGRIDYTARATVTDSAAGQGGAELRALRGVTVPVALTGPFGAIDWKIQWSEVAAKAIENQLKDKLTERLGVELGLPKARDGDTAKSPAKPKDQLRDALKGLFR